MPRSAAAGHSAGSGRTCDPAGRGGGGGGSSVGPDLRIFVLDVADRCGRKRPLTVKTWSTVKDVKDALQRHLHIPVLAQRLYFGPLLASGGELPNHRTLHDAGIYRSGETLLLDIVGGSGGEGGSPALASVVGSSISSLRSASVSDVCVSPSLLDLTPRSLRRAVQRARRGFALGLKPDLVLDGSGGTYYLHDARKVRVAVFKPADEEPYAENNPRGYVRQGGSTASSGDTPLSDFGIGYGDGEAGMRAGIRPGEACVREVAAYLLDHGGFSGVPATTLAEARHPGFNTNGSRLKIIEGGASMGPHSLGSSSSSDRREKKVGSYQEFVKADCSMDDLGPSKLSADEVHKIAILDIRLLNADRNSANLLCRRRPEDPSYTELIPIDHGYCLRTVADVSWFDWCWLDWPQMKKPLSKKAREYVLGLDIEADIRLLKERLHIWDEALDYFRASSRLLQAGVKAGLSLYDIAVMCCRNDDVGEVPSKLEMLMSMAGELATSATENGRWHHTAASRALAEQLTGLDHSGRRNKPVQSGGSSPCGLRKTSASAAALGMLKSASSADFSTVSTVASVGGSGGGPSPQSGGGLPTMVQSSASDSSSNPSDDDAPVEHEECEDWAAAVIADVGLENSRRRSSSFDSLKSEDTSSSSESGDSRAGFWYTRPGSDAGGGGEEEDDDSTWSSQHISSLRTTLGIGRVSLSSLPSGVSPETLLPPVCDDGTSQAASVRFDVSPVLSPSPPSADMPSLELSALEDSENAPLAPAWVGIRRSQSYSAFSSHSATGSLTKEETMKQRRSPSMSDDDGMVHEYYLKFIDLLITRETAAASQQGQRSNGSITILSEE